MKEFSNFDVYVITRELDAILRNSIIVNIYETEDIFILKINTHEGKKKLIIKLDSRINLTDYNYPIPKFPSQYIISLRKLLRNRRILKVYQVNFDRVLVIELINQPNKPWKFVIELFNKGNFILVDENDVIKIAKRYIKLKDRKILANNHYSFPKSFGANFSTIEKDEFYELAKSSNVEIVRTIARNINISGLYSEEICYRSGILKTKTGIELTSNDIDKLYDALKKVRNLLLFGEIDAHIVLKSNKTELHVLPFQIDMFKQNEKLFFDSFNEAVDKFFSKIDSTKFVTPKGDNLKSLIRNQEKILKNQLEYLTSLKKKKEKYYKIGDFVFANFKSLEKLITTINSARSKGYGWNDINEKLQNAKNENLKGSELFEKIIPSTSEVVLKVNNDEVYIDLKKSIGENANQIYLKGKKAKKKIKGTLTAIESTKLKIEKLRQRKESLSPGINFLIKKPKKKWYEKFRWFVSTDNFLVIGGRDATSNELIFKKYLERDDLIFHTIFSGSPLTVVKNPDNKEFPVTTMEEAASFVATFSRAWKESWGVADVFYVNPDQVSKKPPSGEFLPKGSFVISGKKNFVKNARIELAIGLEIVEIEAKNENKIFYPKVISGPPKAIEARSQKYILIQPSKSGLSAGALAKKIKAHFIKNVDDYSKKWVELLSIDDILLYLPTGSSVIKPITKSRE